AYRVGCQRPEGVAGLGNDVAVDVAASGGSGGEHVRRSTVPGVLQPSGQFEPSCSSAGCRVGGGIVGAAGGPASRRGGGGVGGWEWGQPTLADQRRRLLPVIEDDDDGDVHGEDEDRTNRTVVEVVRAQGDAVLCMVTRS